MPEQNNDNAPAAPADDVPRDINGDPINTEPLPTAESVELPPAVDPEAMQRAFGKAFSRAAMEMEGFLRIRRIGGLWVLDMPHGVQVMHPANPQAGEFAKWLIDAGQKIAADAHAAELELAALNGKLAAQAELVKAGAGQPS